MPVKQLTLIGLIILENLAIFVLNKNDDSVNTLPSAMLHNELEQVGHRVEEDELESAGIKGALVTHEVWELIKNV